MKTNKKSHKANAYQRKQQRYIQKKKQENSRMQNVIAENKKIKK